MPDSPLRLKSQSQTPLALWYERDRGRGRGGGWILGSSWRKCASTGNWRSQLATKNGCSDLGGCGGRGENFFGQMVAAWLVVKTKEAYANGRQESNVALRQVRKWQWDSFQPFRWNTVVSFFLVTVDRSHQFPRLPKDDRREGCLCGRGDK